MSVFQAFSEALQAKDFVGMLSAYENAWKQSPSENSASLALMNRALMKECRMPGVYLEPVGEQAYAEIRQTGHCPEDPSPVGVLGVLPLFRQAETPSDAGEYPVASGAFLNTSNRFCSFLPCPSDNGGIIDCVKMLILNKENQHRREQMIHPETGGKEISRIIAVGNEGNFLILELREPPASGRTESFSVVCFNRGGKPEGVLLEGLEESGYKGVLLEDRLFGPRGFLWKPGTLEICSFEYTFHGFIARRGADAFRRSSFGLPIPYSLFPEDPYEMNPLPREAIESVMLSDEADRMIVITREFPRRDHCNTRNLKPTRYLYLYRRETGSWRKFPGMASRRLLATRDLRYLLFGAPAESGSCWHWSLRSADRLSGHSRICDWVESGSESRIVSFSYDACSLLDETGRAVYEICWQYAPGSSPA